MSSADHSTTPADSSSFPRLIADPPPPRHGFPGGVLTPREQHCFDVVKARFSFNGTLDPVFQCEMILLKFCRARDFEVDKVVEMMERHFQWRNRPLFQNPTPKMGSLSTHTPIADLYRVGIHPAIKAKIPLFKKFYPTGYHGTSRCGRPVYVDCIGKIDAGGLLSVATEEEVLEYFIAEGERRECERFPACTLSSGVLVESSIAILDLKGLSFRTVTHGSLRKVVGEGICEQPAA